MGGITISKGLFCISTAGRISGSIIVGFDATNTTNVIIAKNESFVKERIVFSHKAYFIDNSMLYIKTDRRSGLKKVITFLLKIIISQGQINRRNVLSKSFLSSRET